VKRDNVMISGGTGKVNNVIIKWKGRIHGEGRKMGAGFMVVCQFVVGTDAAVRRGQERRKE
jgi:hypothetical protein